MKEYLINRGRDRDERLYKAERFQFEPDELDALALDADGEPVDEDAFEEVLEISAGGTQDAAANAATRRSGDLGCMSPSIPAGRAMADRVSGAVTFMTSRRRRPDVSSENVRAHYTFRAAMPVGTRSPRWATRHAFPRRGPHTHAGDTMTRPEPRRATPAVAPHDRSRGRFRGRPSAPFRRRADRGRRGDGARRVGAGRARRRLRADRARRLGPGQRLRRRLGAGRGRLHGVVQPRRHDRAARPRARRGRARARQRPPVREPRHHARVRPRRRRHRRTRHHRRRHHHVRAEPLLHRPAGRALALRARHRRTVRLVHRIRRRVGRALHDDRERRERHRQSTRRWPTASTTRCGSAAA